MPIVCRYQLDIYDDLMAVLLLPPSYIFYVVSEKKSWSGGKIKFPRDGYDTRSGV